MAGAVGRVQIERHVRVVVGHQLRDGASLWRVELHVIAIQVEPLRVGALALAAHGAVLRAAVVEREALVAVGVVDRRDQEDHRLQPVVVPARGEVAQQHLRAFLALHFAAVDVALDVDAQLAGASHRLRRRARRADHRQRDGALLVGRPHRRQVHAVGRLVDRLEKGHDVGVLAGVAIVRFLGNGADVVET